MNRTWEEKRGGGRYPRGGIQGVCQWSGDVGACSRAFAGVAFLVAHTAYYFYGALCFRRVLDIFQKLSFVFLSPIYPIYVPKTQKDAEFHKEFESAVENAIALQKHIVLKEIL